MAGAMQAGPNQGLERYATVFVGSSGVFNFYRGQPVSLDFSDGSRGATTRVVAIDRERGTITVS